MKYPSVNRHRIEDDLGLFFGGSAVALFIFVVSVVVGFFVGLFYGVFLGVIL